MPAQRIDLDPALERIAYRSSYSVVYDYLAVAQMTGRTLDFERLRMDLAAIVDLDNPHVQAGVEDALAGHPSRW